MRFDKIRVLCFVCPLAILLPGVALAGPTVSLVWTDTTGSGTPGGSSIDAEPGDTLMLGVFVTADQLLVGFAGMSLAFDPAALQGVAAFECPGPTSIPPGSNPVDGSCFGGGWLYPLGPPATIDNASGRVNWIEAWSTHGGIADTELAAVDFVVSAALPMTTVETLYLPGLGSVSELGRDPLGDFLYFPAANAVAVPEPTGAALWAAGLATLLLLSRCRRSRPVWVAISRSAVARGVASCALVLAVALGAATDSTAAPDTDGDTVPDAFDNCTLIPNAPPFDCDTDQDGYGNACDPDTNNDHFVGGGDAAAFNNGYGSMGVPSVADINCDLVGGGPDIETYSKFFGSPPGPSGLSCAGTIPCQ